MSNIHHLNQTRVDKENELILEQACDWIAKIDRALNDIETKQLKGWLSTSPQHQSALLEAAAMWDKTDELSRLSDIFPQATDEMTTPSVSNWGKMAAACLVLALFIGLFQFNQGWQSGAEPNKQGWVAMQKNYQTSIGESQTINLPDSSKIVLNTNSFVQVRYTEHARIIDLQRGELHIDVAHDTSRPLSVIAGGKIIQAVGTAFNVEVRSEVVELIVTDGKVLVAKSDQEQALFSSEVNKLPLTSVAVSKGEKLDLDMAGDVNIDVIKVDPMDIAAKLSWRSGNLIFRGESLEDAMDEIGRYTNIEFELADDEKLKSVHVAGMFKTGDVNGLLAVLSENFNISHEKIAADKIVLKYEG